jgi:hypothetical protein
VDGTALATPATTSRRTLLAIVVGVALLLVATAAVRITLLEKILWTEDFLPAAPLACYRVTFLTAQPAELDHKRRSSSGRNVAEPTSATNGSVRLKHGFADRGANQESELGEWHR